MTKLRTVLTPTASKERIEETKNKILKIENSLHNGESVNLLIEDFNKFTNRYYTTEYFLTYWNSESLDDFSRDAAQPLPQKVEDILKEELIEIVERVKKADENSKFYMDLLEKNLPHPRISNLIFWPKKEGLSDNPTSEEILNKAMAYKPIQL